MVIRAKPGGGFWGLAHEEDYEDEYELWTIHTDGSIAHTGTFAPMPKEFEPLDNFLENPGSINIDAKGALYLPAMFERSRIVILRFNADFETVNVVDDGSGDCKLGYDDQYSFALVTGS